MGAARNALANYLKKQAFKYGKYSISLGNYSP